jgi:hypothetical protein
MMLRASVAHAGGDVDLTSIAGRAGSDLAHGDTLLAFVDAAVAGDRASLARARAALSGSAGWAFTVDAAAVVANFEMMTRVADTTGAAYAETARTATADARSAVGADRLGTSRWG